MRIVTNALVHRVLLDGKRAVGVGFSRQSTVERVEATREVILSAGAIGSPHLLQLSGVGEPEVLQKAGIAVQHALPGVGQNFQDHYIARMSCYVRDLDTLNERARGLGFANEVMRYILQGKGMMTFGASLCAASVKVLPSRRRRTCNASSHRRATSRVLFAGSTTGRALPAARGRCGRSRAAMCWSARPTPTTSRRAIIGLPPPRPKARCRFGQETFAETRGNW